MVLDFAVGAWLVWTHWSGRQLGAATQFTRLFAFSGALAVAYFVTPRTASVVGAALESGPRHAHGLAFFLIFIACWIFTSMATSKVIHKATEAGHATGMDALLGGVAGGGVGAIVGYALLSSGILLTQHIAGEKPEFAFQFNKSRAGTWVMLNNLADPEPFPNAMFLMRVVGAGSVVYQSANKNAGATVLGMANAQFIRADRNARRAIQRKKWEVLRKDPRVLRLLCDPWFLNAARRWLIPARSDPNLDPKDRFEELD